MKKIKAIILTIWFILAVILMVIAPFMFNFIDETLLFLNVFIPLTLIFGDDEIRHMNIF